MARFLNSEALIGGQPDDRPQAPPPPPTPATNFLAPYNPDFVMIGDSRTAQGSQQTITPGASIGQYFYSKGVLSWLCALMGNSIRPAAFANYGIGGQTVEQIFAVPRSDPALGLDKLAANEAASVIILAGTNNGGDTTSLAAGGSARAAMAAAIDYLTNLASAAYPGYGGLLFGGHPKNIILLNDLPRGRFDDGTVASFDGAVLADYATWLLGFDCDSGSAYANPRVLAVDTFYNPAYLDAASGAAYRNLQGLQTDALHQNPVGAYRIAARITAEMKAQPAYSGASLVALPTTATAAGFMIPNPMLVRTDGSGSAVSGVTIDSGVLPDQTWMLGNTGSGGVQPAVDLSYDGDAFVITVTAGSPGSNIHIRQAIDTGRIAMGTDKIVAMAEIGMTNPTCLTAGEGVALQITLDTPDSNQRLEALMLANSGVVHPVDGVTADGEPLPIVTVALDTALSGATALNSGMFSSYVDVGLSIGNTPATFRLRRIGVAKAA